MVAVGILYTGQSIFALRVALQLYITVLPKEHCGLAEVTGDPDIIARLCKRSLTNHIFAPFPR